MQTSSFRELMRRLAIISVIGAGTFATAFAQQNDATMQTTRETPAQLQQLVAPIALYPDQLVAQILAAYLLAVLVDSDQVPLSGRVRLFITLTESGRFAGLKEEDSEGGWRR